MFSKTEAIESKSFFEIAMFVSLWIEIRKVGERRTVSPSYEQATIRYPLPPIVSNFVLF